MEALSDEWVLQDFATAPKAYSRRSCGNCTITVRQIENDSNECSCCQEMDKCAQSLSDEWVLQGVEAQKCLLLIKKVISKLVQKICKLL